ncbi:MAG: ECF transporter S component [Christensenellaceae bacterium]
MNDNVRNGKYTATYVAILGVLTALVCILQLAVGMVHVGVTSFSLSLIPIVLGACILGPVAGGILGSIFGLITLICGINGMDAFTNLLFNTSPVGTTLICMLKGALCGIIPGIVYKALVRKNQKLSAVLACACSPVVNTGIFVVGMLLLMSPFSKALGVSAGGNYVYFVVIGCAGINFLVEFIVNMALSSAVVTVIKYATAKYESKK